MAERCTSQGLLDAVKTGDGKDLQGLEGAELDVRRKVFSELSS